MEKPMVARTVQLLPAKCALDIGDGSERGEYVCQDYILNILGRPHRAVDIMYTYYPNDIEWPARISQAHPDMEVGFTWDYPYDDYYPFCEGGKQVEQMRDIRRHGQEVMLTITADCAIDDEHIRGIAAQLRPFGRMFLRINHECNGTWFTHNKRFSYEEIAAFFVRFARIVKEVAPNVRMVFCAGLICSRPDEDGIFKVQYEDVFAPAYEIADVWSADKYLALHFGWPFDTAEPLVDTYTVDPPEVIFDRYVRTYARLSERFGPRPFIQAEFNADGDVMGPLHQAEPVTVYYDLVKEHGSSGIAGISMYQFRDRGRLGLEVEDPNNPSVGIRQPLLDRYREVLKDPFFMPQFKSGEKVTYPVTMRWGGSEDSDGIEIDVSFEKTPEFCEVTFEKDLNLIMEFNGRWFYKKAGVETVDLMSAFFDENPAGAFTVPLRIFATCADGENHENGRDDWSTDQYFAMESEPVFRIRYDIPGNYPIIKDEI